jgi:hypothetical protein
MNILESVFKSASDRDGKLITIGSATYKVIFKRNEKGANVPYITMFALESDPIEQGQVFTINNEKYLIIKELTAENLTYRKFECIKCNATIKWMYGKNDLVIYDCYMVGIADSLKSSTNATIINSKIEVWLPLNNDSKRINLNGRFFCGSYQSANKIVDINYLNGLCYLYAERDTIQSTDDTTNGIAGRWNYDDKPNEYSISINESDIEIEEDATKQLTVAVSKNGSLMETQPTINWTILDGSVCSVDSSNIVTGLIVGSTKITGSYKATDNDTCTSDTVNVIVKEKPVIIGDVVVTPVYNYGTYYGLKTSITTTFTASISGLENPQWNITVNPNGNTSAYYTATVNNLNGTFTVKTLKSSSYKLLVTVTEQTTGKSMIYSIGLLGIM